MLLIRFQLRRWPQYQMTLMLWRCMLVAERTHFCTLRLVVFWLHCCLYWSDCSCFDRFIILNDSSLCLNVFHPWLWFCSKDSSKYEKSCVIYSMKRWKIEGLLLTVNFNRKIFTYAHSQLWRWVVVMHARCYTFYCF